MLLDKQGHLKLADFGTCMRMDKVCMYVCMYLFVYAGYFIYMAANEADVDLRPVDSTQ